MGIKHYVDMVASVVFACNGSSDCNFFFFLLSVKTYVFVCVCVLECALLGIEMY